MQPESFHIVVTQQAKLCLAAIKDKRHQALLIQRIEQLAQEPEQQGKALIQELKGFRSIRAVGQRYRIVYKVELERVLVIVVGIGLRKEGDKSDIYTLLKRLLKRGELDVDE